MAPCWFQDKIIYAKMTATISAIFLKSKQPHTHKQCNQAYMFLQNAIWCFSIFMHLMFFQSLWRPGQTADAEDNRKCVTMTTADVMSHWLGVKVGDFKPAPPRAKISLCLHSTFEPRSPLIHQHLLQLLNVIAEIAVQR